jgi:molybdenum cofactor cytidylyltransferase
MYVVLGAQAAEILPSLEMRRVRVLINEEPERGQFSSLKLALESLSDVFDGCLVWPVDQPLVSASLVRGLAGLFANPGVQLALPRRNTQAGHPGIFGRKLITELLELSPEDNPKTVIERYKSGAAWLDCEEPGAFEDIDTPEDYRRILGKDWTMENPEAGRKDPDRT